MKNGQLLGIVYEMFFVYFIPACIGTLSFIFYKIIFSNFKVGKNIKCWGSVIIRKSPEGIISIGDNVRISSDFLRAGSAHFSKVKISVFWNSKIVIGNDVALCGTSITDRTTSKDIPPNVLAAGNPARIIRNLE